MRIDAVFKASLNERYQSIKHRIDLLMTDFIKGDREVQLRLSASLESSIDDLFAIIPTSHRPTWANSIKQSLVSFRTTQNDSEARELILTLARVWNQIAPVNVQESNDSGFDFDKLYAEYRDTGRIKELFEQLIEQVKSLIPEVESNTAINALKEILSILQENKSGSYVAVQQSLRVSSLTMNLLKEGLKTIPAVGVVMTSWGKTTGEAEKELEKIQTSMNNQIIAQLGQQLPRLKILADYVEQISAFIPPTPQPKLISDTTPNLDDVAS